VNCERHRLAPADWRRAAASAVLAAAIFLLVGRASGTLDVAGGFGWDGVAYAHMVTESLRAGTGNTAMRPLVVLAVRVPYALGADLLTSFRVVNLISAATLFAAVALLLARRGASPMVQAMVPINLALCIATSKMYGFYPALIDLGALAVITVAFSLVGSRGLVITAAACVAAASSREFGVAVALYGVHRAVRLRRPWTETAAVYLPALLVPVILRVPAFGFVPAASGPSTLLNAIAGLRMLTGASYLIAFGYFSATLFGGLTLFLIVRWSVCVRALRREPELLTFLVIVFALTVAAGVDIWRYLVFSLPAVIVLAADGFRDLDAPVSRAIVVAILAITVLTQHPLERMTTEAYFRDWFPTYLMGGSRAEREELLRVWWPRLMLMPLSALGLVAVLYAGRRRKPALSA
jgi:hypothetical protein